jgi:hypothetical protein
MIENAIIWMLLGAGARHYSDLMNSSERYVTYDAVWAYRALCARTACADHMAQRDGQCRACYSTRPSKVASDYREMAEANRRSEEMQWEMDNLEAMGR